MKRSTIHGLFIAGLAFSGCRHVAQTSQVASQDQGARVQAIGQIKFDGIDGRKGFTLSRPVQVNQIRIDYEAQKEGCYDALKKAYVLDVRTGKDTELKYLEGSDGKSSWIFGFFDGGEHVISGVSAYFEVQGTPRCVYPVYSLSSDSSQTGSEKSSGYYMVLWSYQGILNKLNFDDSHTFASFVKGAYDGSEFSIEDIQTISWLPIDPNSPDYPHVGPIDTIGGRPRPGKNFSLEQSLAEAPGHVAKAAHAGPYKISEEVFEKAIAWRSELDNGGTLYVANDDMIDGIRPRAMNCIHAVSDLAVYAKGAPMLHTRMEHGLNATAHVLRYFKQTGVLIGGEPSPAIERAFLDAVRRSLGSTPGVGYAPGSTPVVSGADQIDSGARLPEYVPE